MFSLAGKVAVVTGGGSGIGEAVARCFAAAGTTTYIADRDRATGERVAGEIGGRFIAVDIADEVSCRAAAGKVLAAHAGGCDILVNNAGIGHVGTVLTTTPADLDRLYAVNVKGVLHMTQQFLPAMVARRWGSVINIASVGGIVGVRDRFAYCATKFAVVGMTKCMALDHASSRVRFNAVCPGRVETPFVQARISEYADPVAARREMEATQALGRMAQPDEIAAAVLYLATDESACVTGTAMLIDGGWTAGK